MKFPRWYKNIFSNIQKFVIVIGTAKDRKLQPFYAIIVPMLDFLK